MTSSGWYAIKPNQTKPNKTNTQISSKKKKDNQMTAIFHVTFQ